MRYYLYRILISLLISGSFPFVVSSQITDIIIINELPVIDISDSSLSKHSITSCFDGSLAYKKRYTATDYGVYNHPLEFLKGKLPALFISSQSGSPGSDYTISSMGFNSVQGYTNATILLNGLPIDNFLKFINYQDIESYSSLFDDLKYPQFSGSDANGLLPIKTKGTEDEFHLFCSFKSALSWLPQQVDVLSGDEFRSILNQIYSEHPEILAMAGNSSTNWQKEITRKGFTHDAYISTDFKKGKFPMRFSYGNSKTEGIIRNSDLTKNTFSFKMDPSFLKGNLMTELNLLYTDYNENKVDDNAFNSAIFFAPSSPVRDNNSFGNYFAWNSDNGTTEPVPKNPVALINQLHNNEKASFLDAGLTLEYDFNKIEGLTVGINSSLINLTQNQTITLDTLASWYTSSWKNIQFQTKTLKAFLNPFVRFEKPYQEDSYHLSIEAGYYNHFDKTEKFNRINGKSLSYLSYSEMSAYTTASIRYHNLYSLQTKLTIENSPWFYTSTFIYPALSGIWNIGEEKFMDGCNFLTDLTLYSTYSISSNSPLSQFEQVVIPANLNPSRTRKFNTGLNGVIENIRLGFSINYYNNFNQNVYFTRTNYIQGGYEEELINSFSMRNSGLILSLMFKNMLRGNIRYDIRLSLNYNKNRITDFNELPGINVLFDYNSRYTFPPEIYYEGEKINSLCLLQQQYDEDGKPVEGSYKLDGVEIAGMKTAYRTDRSALPNIIAGINGTLTYKDWEFMFSGRFIAGNYVYNRLNANSVYSVIEFPGLYLNNLTTDINNTEFYNQQFYSDYYLQNASFFRMDLIGLGYTFNNIKNKGYNLKITSALQNAFTITKYSGIDPEVDSGEDKGAYPRARTFALGVVFEY